MKLFVHVLNEGLALCGQEGVPSEWPENHRWVHLSKWKKANCSLCLMRALLHPKIDMPVCCDLCGRVLVERPSDIDIRHGFCTDNGKIVCDDECQEVDSAETNQD